MLKSRVRRRGKRKSRKRTRFVSGLLSVVLQSSNSPTHLRAHPRGVISITSRMDGSPYDAQPILITGKMFWKPRRIEKLKRAFSPTLIQQFNLVSPPVDGGWYRPGFELCKEGRKFFLCYLFLPSWILHYLDRRGKINPPLID